MSINVPEGPVAVISTRFWQSRFYGAAGVIGKTLTIERVPCTIIGFVRSRKRTPHYS